MWAQIWAYQKRRKMYQNVTLFRVANSGFLKTEYAITTINTRIYNNLISFLKRVQCLAYGTGGYWFESSEALFLIVISHYL